MTQEQAAGPGNTQIGWKKTQTIIAQGCPVRIQLAPRSRAACFPNSGAGSHKPERWSQASQAEALAWLPTALRRQTSEAPKGWSRLCHQSRPLLPRFQLSVLPNTTELRSLYLQSPHVQANPAVGRLKKHRVSGGRGGSRWPHG